LVTESGTIGRYLRWLLAAFSIGAGVIHFAVSGEHYDLSWRHGAFFTAVAWLQLAWAIGVILRPTRRLLAVGVVLNAGVIGVWTMSRIWGVPVGPEAWTPEPVELADAVASGLEGLIVVCALAVLAEPGLARRAVRPAVGLSGALGAALGVAVLSSLALTPSFATSHEHGHGADGGSDAVVAGTACGKSGEPVFQDQHHATHHHRGPSPWQPLRDAAIRAQYAAQIEQARDAAGRFPTVQDAEAAGYRILTTYLPCVGAHYVHDALYTAGQFDAAAPPILIYDGTGADSEIVGLSYIVKSDTAPAGFAGPNDLWHTHARFCISRANGLVLGAENISDRRCAAAGGENVGLRRDWMMHAWVVPGWESSWGIFSGEHPDLGGRNTLRLKH
jgi:hypothetical protein